MSLAEPEVISSSTSCIRNNSECVLSVIAACVEPVIEQIARASHDILA